MTQYILSMLGEIALWAVCMVAVAVVAYVFLCLGLDDNQPEADE